MSKRIIYPSGDGIAVIIPSGTLPVAELARRDVPAGVPFRVIPASSLPTDRLFRGAWTADFSQPDGHGIGPEAWHAEQRDGGAA